MTEIRDLHMRMEHTNSIHELRHIKRSLLLIRSRIAINIVQDECETCFMDFAYGELMQKLKKLGDPIETIPHYAQFVQADTLGLSVQEKCSICFDVHIYKDAVLTDCNHSFGYGCLYNWCSNKHTCPLCRKKIRVLYLFRDIQTSSSHKKQQTQ